VNTDGQILDEGSTALDVGHDEVSLHLALYAARDNIRCVIHIASPSAILVCYKYFLFLIGNDLLKLTFRNLCEIDYIAI